MRAEEVEQRLGRQNELVAKGEEERKKRKLKKERREERSKHIEFKFKYHTCLCYESEKKKEEMLIEFLQKYIFLYYPYHI